MLESFKVKQNSELEKALREHSAKTEKAEPGLFKKIFGDKLLIYNLALMIFVWVSASFSFYLLNFLVKYMPGDIYFNSIISGLSCAAMLIEGQMQDKLGTKGGMVVSFILTCVSTVLLCLFVHGTD